MSIRVLDAFADQETEVPFKNDLFKITEMSRLDQFESSLLVPAAYLSSYICEDMLIHMCIFVCIHLVYVCNTVKGFIHTEKGPPGCLTGRHLRIMF